MTNAERYKTADERLNAHHEMCIHKDGCNCIGKSRCLLEWLEKEAEEEKPLPCPFCGAEAILYATGMPYVRCDNCKAQTTAYQTPEEAVAAWNRRTR